MRTTVRYLLIALSAIAAAVLGLNQASLAPLSKGQMAGLIVGIAVLAILSPALEEYFSRTADQTQAQKLQYEKQLSDALRTGMVLVTQLVPDLTWLQMSASVFLLKSERSGLRTRAQTMDRVVYERFSSFTPPQPATWSKNTGVVGRVWQTAAEQTADFTAIGQNWAALTLLERLNMTQQELDAVQPKEGVIAAPLIRNGAVYGVVSFSAPSALHNRLTLQAVWLVLRQTRDSIQNLAAPGMK